jgi:hypothetical protein
LQDPDAEDDEEEEDATKNLSSVVSAVKKPGKVSILMNLHFGQKLCKTNFK